MHKVNNNKMTKSQTVSISDIIGQIKAMENTHIKKWSYCMEVASWQ